MKALRDVEADLYRFRTRVVAATVLVGLVFGLTQTVRGAHFPSHTFWTAWICWTVGLVVYHLAAAPRSVRPD